MGTYNKEYYEINQAGSKKNFIFNRTVNNRTVLNLPEPKRHRGSGGYYLSAIGSSGSRLGHIADNIFSFGVLKAFLLLLILGNFVRFVLDDPNGLSFGVMLRQLSQVKTIPTDWIGNLTSWVREGLIGESTNINYRNFIQLITNLILPLPTILYLIVGLLNIIWWLTSVFSIFFGTFMF